MAQSKKNPIYIDILITSSANQYKEERQDSASIICNQALFFSGKSANVASKTKREGQPDRRLGPAKLILNKFSFHIMELGRSFKVSASLNCGTICSLAELSKKENSTPSFKLRTFPLAQEFG